jgi:LmbE family N-acetylglucosaminyl deacetylase
MEEHKVEDFKPKVVLGIAAHPDDLDFGASGSMSKWAEMGADVYYLILTDGSKGSDDPKMTSSELTAIRRTEQQAAAKQIGAKDVFFFNYPDAMLEVTMELKRDICRVIRKIKPDSVITMDPTMLYELNWNFVNHPDHRAAGQAVVDSVFPLARDRLTFPELAAEGLEPHKVENLFLINFTKTNFVVDISDTLDKKLKALGSHVSQMKDVESTLAMISQRNQIMGKEHGYGYAESFIRIELSV